MFAKKTDPVPVGGKPPAIGGGAAMMLKSMGIDPAQMEALAEAFLTDVGSMAKRVETLEKDVAGIKDELSVIRTLLEQIAAR